MTKARDGLFVWVTWLSKLMVGEVKCQWATWFRARYTDYSRAPSDFQVAQWTMEHTELLDALVRERRGLGESVYLEDQNRFRVKRVSGLVLAGKPDLVTIDPGGVVTVYDAKTGNPRQSDLVQVMLYMLCLPYSSPMYRGKTVTGCVVYSTGSRSDVPAVAIDKAFTGLVSRHLDQIELSDAPPRVPSEMECRFCDITHEDCPDRYEVGSGQTSDGDAIIPI